MAILQRMFGVRIETRGDVAYHKAMRANDDLISRMRECSISNDAARGVMADVWSQHHNVPFMTTVYESVQEAKSGSDQHSEKKK